MSQNVVEVKEEPGDPLGGGSGEKRHFTVEYIGKTNNPDFPFTIANEVVATQVGLALGLNLPTVITATVGNEPIVLIQSLDRDLGMQAPPPPTAAKLKTYVDEHPDEVHGAIVFDLYVANNDRAFGPQRRNVMLNDQGKLVLIDQGNACFYRPRPIVGILAGIPRLDAVEKSLPAMFDMDHKGNHYRGFLTNWQYVENWCERIRALPEFLIAAAVGRIPVNLERPSDAERQRLIEFLLSRRGRLFDQIVQNRSYFPGLPKRKRRRS